MKIKLLFFAVLRDITGASEREVQVAPGTRPSDLWEQLRAEYPRLATYRTAPLAAVNENYVPADAELLDGDELAFIPPVAGG